MILMLKKAILNNWKTDIEGYAQSITELEEGDYPAWTVKYYDSYGVAIPYDGTDDINESFASAKIRNTNITFHDGRIKRALVLTSDAEDIRSPFASLCEALIEPGEEGSQRAIVETDPLNWWKEWKELLGNKNIDERIYDVLGELCVLLYLVKHGKDVEWNGPDGASYDIEADERFVEVKSSIKRDRTEVTISSEFQLFPPGKSLDLIFCRFEPVIQAGVSIDSILQDFNELGYNIGLLNKKLEMLGFEKGMSARKKKFVLQQMLQYEVNESFPRITPESFIGGTMPAGIQKIAFTVDLTGLQPISLLKKESNEI